MYSTPKKTQDNQKPGALQYTDPILVISTRDTVKTSLFHTIQKNVKLCFAIQSK